MAAPPDPYRNFRFKLEISGMTVAAFSDATLPDTSQDPIEYRNGNDPIYVRKLSGLIKYGSLTLKRGVTDNLDIYNWRQLVEEKGSDGQGAKKDVTLVLIDTEGNDKATWNIYQCWPSKYSSSEFSAKGNDVLIETLELAIA